MSETDRVCGTCGTEIPTTVTPKRAAKPLDTRTFEADSDPALHDTPALFHPDCPIPRGWKILPLTD